MRFIIYSILTLIFIPVSSYAQTRQYVLTTGYNRASAVDDIIGAYRLNGNGAFIAFENSWQNKTVRNSMQVGYWGCAMNSSNPAVKPTIAYRFFSFQYERLSPLPDYKSITFWLGGGLATRVGVRLERDLIGHISGEFIESLEFIARAKYRINDKHSFNAKINLPIVNFVVNNGIRQTDIKYSFKSWKNLRLIQINLGYDLTIGKNIDLTTGYQWYYLGHNIQGYNVKTAFEQFFLGLKYNIDKAK